MCGPKREGSMPLEIKFFRLTNAGHDQLPF
jgi:hypothetical protein